MNDVVHRAAVVAERRAAVHAARSLHAGLRVIEADDEFAVVLEALGHAFVALFEAPVFHETCGLSHVCVLVNDVLTDVPSGGHFCYIFCSLYRWCSGLFEHFSFINFRQGTLVFGGEHLDELAA